MINRRSGGIFRYLWILLVFTLPVTSMPLVVKLSGSDSVAPLSGLFLLILMVFWFIPYILKKGRLPYQSLPLFLFTLSAVVSTLLVVFREVPPYKDISVFASTIKSVFTLMIGLSFYLVSSAFLASTKLFQLTRQVINWSGLLVILWSIFQVVIYASRGVYFNWMQTVQMNISTSQFFQNRATGFALEPSWLAHQLNLLYLPSWLAASITRNSAHKYKAWLFIFEDLLLLCGAVTLLLTLSRVGIMAFILMLGFLFLRLNFLMEKGLEEKVLKSSQGVNRLSPKVFRILFFLILGCIYLGVILVVIQIFKRFDPRMANLFSFSDFKDNIFLRYANSLKFGERIVYWLAAWEVFGLYPLLGVGLGMVGYYFPQNIIGYGWTLYEVRMLIYRSTGLLNAKSLWFRLLAETGLIGFTIFIGWLIALIFSTHALFMNKLKNYQFFGWMGAFFLIGFAIEGFSIDSFALPFLWFSAAMISASSNVMMDNVF